MQIVCRLASLLNPLGLHQSVGLSYKCHRYVRYVPRGYAQTRKYISLLGSIDIGSSIGKPPITRGGNTFGRGGKRKAECHCYRATAVRQCRLPVAIIAAWWADERILQSHYPIIYTVCPVPFRHAYQGWQ